MQLVSHRNTGFVRPASLSRIARSCAFGAALLTIGWTSAHGEEAPLSGEATPLLRAVALQMFSRDLQTTPTATNVRKLNISEDASTLDMLVAACARKKQLADVAAVSPFPIALRIGALLSPRTKFDVGIDVSIPQLHLLPRFSSRIDADAIFSANFGGLSSIFPLTFDQILSRGLVSGTRVYAGGGVGPYIGGVTRFGGKIFVGGEFTSHLGAEFDVHFSGSGDPLLTLQARIGL